jgi:tRNA(adenine34) deaminase
VKIDEIYMREALKQAEKAAAADEIPVGAVVVYKRKIIARAHNQIITLRDPTAHAEMIAITQAANFLKTERLLNCVLYATIEPCPMCAGAMVLARITRLVYGAADPKSGAAGSVVNLINNSHLNHRIKIKSRILEADCSLILRDFFKQKRKQGRK